MPESYAAQRHLDQTLRGLTKMFLAGLADCSEEQIAHLDTELCRLIEMVETEARAELARSLAPVPQAPARAVRRLAFDEEIEVAGPALAQSVHLTADDLAHLARGRGPAHQAAICERPQLDVIVTDALLDGGDAAIAHKVAGHRGAAISLSGFGVLIARAQQDEDLAARIGARADIPAPALKALIAYVGAETRARILAEAGHESGEVVRRVIAEMNRGVGGPPRDFATARAEVGALVRDGRLDEAAIARFARERRHEATAVAVSIKSGAPVELVDRLFRVAGKALLVPCRAANFAWPTVTTILRLCAMGRSIPPVELDRHLAAYVGMTRTAAQGVLRYWVMQGGTHADGTAARRQRLAANHRCAPRRVVNAKGAVLDADDRLITECTIVDVSAGGAKVEFAVPTQVPDEIVLRLAAEDGPRRPCHVMWRSGAAVGVRFRTICH